MIRQPRVSIGLHAFNGGAYLSRALEATLGQTYGDFELIISDNASTDGTSEICADFARADRRIRFVRQLTNCGVNRNHLRVFQMATGEFFRWGSTDDIPAPELLEHAVARLDRDPRLVAYVPDTVNIDASGTQTQHLERSLDLRSPDPVLRADAVLSRHYQMVFPQGLMRRSTMLTTHGRWDYFGWDFVLLFELALRGHICNVEGPLLYRRRHSESAAVQTRNVAEVRKWVDPTIGSRILLPHWKWNWERLRGALASPLSWLDRRRLLVVLGRHVRWDRSRLARDLTMAMRLVLGRTDQFPF